MANRVLRVVAAVIERDGKYLITQRRDEAVLGGLWEFPGGRVEAGESDEAALHREVLGRIVFVLELCFEFVSC
jgi:8-oxo-dGTP diphosphatase